MWPPPSLGGSRAGAATRLDPPKVRPLYSTRMSRLTMAAVAVCLATAARASDPVVRQITFDTDINGASARRIIDAIDAADASNDALVLLILDTPGGSVDATETVVKRMLAA